MESDQIRDVSSSDKAAVNAILTVAFAQCPLLRWLYPNLERYMENIPEFVKHYCGEFYNYGSGVYYPSSRRGAVTWLPADVPQEKDSLMSFLYRSVTSSQRDEVVALFDKFAEFHPKEPYSYLTMVGVDPMQWGRGAATTMMKYFGEKCDSARTQSYLEATSEKAVRVYQRLGWKVLDVVQVGSCPPMYPMIRALQSERPGRSTQSGGHNEL